MPKNNIGETDDSDLGKYCPRITVALYADAGLDEVELAKIEYGLSLSLGIALTWPRPWVLAALLGYSPGPGYLALTAEPWEASLSPGAPLQQL